jgi:PAS domain S-box-containing protein
MSQTPHQTSAKTLRRKKFNFPRWLPVAASAMLMAVVAFVAAGNMKGLKNATFWREHTFQTILAAQSFQNNFIDIQRGMRGYVTLGDTNALASYQVCASRETGQFDQLARLVSDNHAQQLRLKILAAAMQATFSYDSRMIGLYNQQGSTAVSKSDATGEESRTLSGRVLAALKEFSGEEQKLLAVRDVSEQQEYHNAGHLLVIVSTLAAVLLLFANFMSSRELTQRQRAEAKLTQTLLLQKAILNSSDYGIVSTDPDGTVKTFNPAAEKMLGYSADEIVGKATPMLWRDPKEIAERAHQLSQKLGIPVRPTFETIAVKVQSDQIDEGEWTFIRKDGSRFASLLVITALSDEIGNFTGFLGVFRDISQRRQHEMEREKLVVELQGALAQVKALSGLIPICAWCKNIRNDKGYWQNVEQYVRSNTDATFTHGVCPDCAEKFKDDILRKSSGPDDLLPTI